MTAKAEIIAAYDHAEALKQADADPQEIARAFQRWEDLNDQWEQENPEEGEDAP